jgi:hypothetical protein
MRRVLSAVLAVLLLPSVARAALPAFPNHRIVPGKSVAGVRIGMAAASAIATWGGNDACPPGTNDGSCTWTGPTGRGSATLSLQGGKVSSIDLRLSTSNRGYPIYKGALMKLKTSKKIGLRSTIPQIVKAYPKVKGSPSGPALGSGAHTTTFSTSGGRATEITIGPAL